MRFEETVSFLKMIEDHVDIVNVSAGLHSEIGYFRNWCPNMYMPRMPNVHYAAALKKLLRCKISTVGAIMNLDNAERILAEGWGRFRGLCPPADGRPRHGAQVRLRHAGGAPPPARAAAIAAGASAPIRTLACAVNPKLGREDELEDGAVRRARTRKTVAVVGAGPAGLQAALTLTEARS